MPQFLVESYAVKSASAFRNACALARKTAEIDERIRYVDTTYLPGDETALHLFDAPCVDELDRAARRAGLQFERIVQAVNDLSDKRREIEDA